MISTEKQQKYQLCHPDKYKYFTGKEILRSDQSRIIGQAKFTYFPLAKTFEKKQKQLKNKGKNKLKLQKF